MQTAELQKLRDEVAARGGTWLPAAYVTGARSGDASSASYRLVPQTGYGPFVVLGIERPNADAMVRILVGSRPFTYGQVYGPHILDNFAAAVMGRLPAPVVVLEAQRLIVEADSLDDDDLNAGSLRVYGFHTDIDTAQYLRARGECFAVTLDSGALVAEGAPSPLPRMVFDYETHIRHVVEVAGDFGGQDGVRNLTRVDVRLGNYSLHPDGDNAAAAVFVEASPERLIPIDIVVQPTTSLTLHVAADDTAGGTRFAVSALGSVDYGVQA